MIRPTSIRCWRGRSAPTSACTARDLYVVNSWPIKLTRQATRVRPDPRRRGGQGRRVSRRRRFRRRRAGHGQDNAREAAELPREAAGRAEPDRHLRIGAARTGVRTRWSALPLLRAQSSSAWATMPTRAAPPTWASIPTCFLDTCRSAKRLASASRGSRFRNSPAWICEQHGRRRQRTQAAGAVRGRIESRRALRR